MLSHCITPCYIMLIKVGSGYTINELRELGQKLKPFWHKFDVKHPPESILLAPGFKVINSTNCHLYVVRKSLICGWSLKTQKLYRLKQLKLLYQISKYMQLLTMSVTVKAINNSMATDNSMSFINTHNTYFDVT